MTSPIPPGSIIGILGSGQLGRMSALAAAQLGYRTHIYAPDALNSPAAQVSAFNTQAKYEDIEALTEFANQCDIITLEFENLPVDALEAIHKITDIRPGLDILTLTQDRLLEKQFANDHGLETTPFAAIHCHDDLLKLADILGDQYILKTTRFGYDGKGQKRITSPIISSAQAAEIWQELGSVPLIAEGFIDFQTELSVIVARSPSGDIQCYEPSENFHQNQILKRSVVPGNFSESIIVKAQEIAVKFAESLNLAGLIAIELFLTKDQKLLINEFAPRPHNSGHWTQDACLISQFEQHIRAICDLPLGSSQRIADVEMHNLLGDEALDWLKITQSPNAGLHLYGKSDVKPGRKMGHVNYLK